MKNIRHNQVIIWICITLFTIQLGCAHLPQCPTEQVRANLGAIGIVLVGTPEVRIDIPPTGYGRAAMEGVGETLSGAGGGGDGLGACIAIIVVAPIWAAIKAAGWKDVQQYICKTATQGIIAKLSIQETIRDHLLLVAQEETEHDFRLINLQDSPEPGKVDSYNFLKGKEIDTVLEIRVQNIRVKGKRVENSLPLVFFLDVRTRLIRLMGGEELYMRTFHHRSGARQCTDWNDEEFESSCKILAERIVEEVFLLIDLPLGSRREGTRGLQPKYPELSYNFEGDLKYVEVDSLQPELQWETFPRPEDRQSDDTGVLSRITDATYDLKIWKADENGFPVELVYTRKELPCPSHRIETPLPPSTKYLWSIRLRFKMDGHSRVSHWALSREGDHFRFVTPDK